MQVSLVFELKYGESSNQKLELFIYIIYITVIQARAHVLDDVISSVFRGYKSEVRPYCNKANNTVVVTIDIGVRQVVDLVMNWLRRVSNTLIMQ